MTPSTKSAFTLIELSIVLVVVGLVIGGVLMGKDLIRAGATRAQIAQIQSYQAATKAFELKFLALPGDIPARLATRFGFAARGAVAGGGDGNGIIEGVSSCAPGQNQGAYQTIGETAMFWSDLTYANGINVNLIDGGFRAAYPCGYNPVILPNLLSSYFPASKLGGGNYVYIYSSAGLNYFGVSVVKDGGLRNPGALSTAPGLPVNVAYMIDRKIDDGFPMSGTVQAKYLGDMGVGGYYGVVCSVPSGVNAQCTYMGTFAAAASSCFDDNNDASTPFVYSIGYKGGNAVNCGLSFELQ